MQIYIKTSPYKNNSYAQHLIEHCVCYGYPNKDHFFLMDTAVEAMSWLDYTSFTLYDISNPKEFLKHITSPLDSKIVSKEKKKIATELGAEKSNGDLLVNRIGKELYGKDFGWGHASFPITQKELYQLHQEQYCEENIRITDNNFVIQQRPKISKKTGIWENTYTFEDRKIKIRGKTHFIKIFKEDGPQTYATLYFLDRIINNRNRYQKSYLGGDYYFTGIEFFEYPQHLILFSKEPLSFEMEKDFFIKAKEYFLKDPALLNEISLIYEIRNREELPLELLKNEIQKLNYEQLRNLF